jgi:Spy/CpxP family protein refolding chaperone
MDNNQSNRKAVRLLFVLFALGIALGSVGTYLVTTRVQAARPYASLRANYAGTVALFSHGLSLSQDQEKQVEAIFTDMRDHYNALHAKLDPEYDQVRQEGRERIRQILTPEQRPKFEELLRQIDADRRRREMEGHD